MTQVLPVFSTCCNVTFLSLAGKLIRMRPCALVVVDSASTTDVILSRIDRASLSSPVISNFTIGSRLVSLDFCQRSGFTLLSIPLQCE